MMFMILSAVILCASGIVGLSWLPCACHNWSRIMMHPLPPTSSFSLPQHILQYARTGEIIPGHANSCVRALSFVTKPTSQGIYENRTLDLYVGIYILRGSGTFIDHLGRKHLVRQGQYMQMPPRLAHTFIQNPDGLWIEAWLTLRPSFAEHLVQIGMVNYDKTVMTPGLHQSLLNILDQLNKEMRCTDAFAASRAVVCAEDFLVRLYMYADAATPHDAQQSLVDDLCHILSQNLDGRVDLPNLVSRFPLSYERIRKIFKARTGYSLVDYRIRKRIELAEALLEHRQMTIKEVARRLGYPDPFTFSRQFRKVTGRPPSAYN